MKNYLNNRLSYYRDIRDTQSTKEISFNEFLDLLMNGDHTCTVKEVRSLKTAKNDDLAKAKKETLPLVTISGTFSPHTDNGLKTHSGLLVLDFDEFESIEEVQEAKNKVSRDPFSFVVFESAGGNLAVVVKIDPEKHKESFDQLAEHYFKEYGLIVDQSGKNVSRYRYLSYDPYYVLNDNSLVFKTSQINTIPAISKDSKEIKGVISNEDFEQFVKWVELDKIDITAKYSDWVAISYAIANQFGENGFNFFDRLSRFNPNYNQATCLRQFNSTLKSINQNNGDTNEVTLKTVIWIAKNQGFLMPKTKPNIISSPTNNETNTIRILNFLKDNHSIIFNQVTNRIEVDGVQISDSLVSDLWIETTKHIGKDFKMSIIGQLLNSNSWEKYHPIKLWFESNNVWDEKDRIREMADSLNSETPELAYKYLKSFLIGMVHMVYGTPNHLVLSLIGGQGTGKTVFCKDLLPPDLRGYFAESHLLPKDRINTMNQNLLVLDDEFIGLGKMTPEEVKSLLSTTVFKTTQKYDKYESALPRMASIITATNREDILPESDNRRILPIKLKGVMNFKALNAIDRKQVFAQAYWSYLEGEDWQLLGKDQTELNEHGANFREEIFENELIGEIYRKPNSADTFREIQFVSATTAMHKIHELKGVPYTNLDIKKIGSAFKFHGFSQISKKIEGQSKKVYEVVQKG